MFPVRRNPPRAGTPDAAAFDELPLATCPSGVRATILRIGCGAGDAQRLRAMGLVEGTDVDVVDTRSGILLDVRGSRLALGSGLAAAITVQLVSP